MMRSIAALGLLCFLVLSGRSGAAVEGTRITLGVNGKTPTADRKQVPYDAYGINFVVTAPLGQMRYRLVGLEQEWQPRNGDMFLLVRFLNAKGDQIGQQAFLTTGRSPGWRGSVDNSPSTDRSEKVVAPDDAHYVSIAISSAGPASTIGTFAISDAHVFTKTRDLIGPATATQWLKGGTRPSMAFAESTATGSPLYVIRDDDITGHADWKTVLNDAAEVSPGETLQIQWKELYSTGMGNPFSQNYGRLPPGNYRFEVEALGFSGVSHGDLTVFSFTVTAPWWKDPWYWAALVAVTAIISSLLGQHLIRKKIQRHLHQAQLIADERLRIARDLHDDLGARLSHISLLGSHAGNITADTTSQQTFRQITSMSRELITSLSETVWMLNSKNDHLNSLIDYLCRMVSELCKSLDIRCRIDAVSPPDDQPVSSEIRHNVSLAVKESVNNALKHSGCSEIRLKINLVQNGLEISIADNGIGLNATGSEQGNGLENIRQRMSTLKGSLQIGESEEGGVNINLHIPL